MENPGFTPFSESEALTGKQFAQKKFKMDSELVLMFFLQFLANFIRGRMERTGESFETARVFVLNKAHLLVEAHLFDSKPERKELQKAFESALGKMFSDRKRFLPKRRSGNKKKRKEVHKESGADSSNHVDPFELS